MNENEDRREAEQDFQKLLDVLPQYFCVYGANAEPLYANDSLLDFFGFTLDDFRADDFQTRAFHPDDVQRVQSVRKEAISRGEGWEVEARIRRKDDQYRWFLIRGKPFRDESGKIIRWFSSGTDIEDLKRTEQQLQSGREIQAIYQQLVHSSMDGILAFDKQGCYTVWNPGLDRIFGVKEIERLGKEASDLCPFFRGTGGKNCYASALAGEGVVATDIPYVFPGTTRKIFLDGFFSPLRNSTGETMGGLAIIRDVTERKRAQWELEQLVDAVPQHVVVLNGDGERIYANQAARDYHGLTLEEFLVEPINDCFYPGDVEPYRRLRDAGLLTGDPWEAEARLRRKDGQYRWFLIRGNPFRDEQGTVIRWYLARTDIEDRKLAERELEQLVDAVPQLIVVFNGDGSRLYANQVVLDFFGLTLQEFLSDEKVWQSFHPDELKPYLECRNRGFAGAAPFQLETRIRRRDAQYRWFLFLYNPFKNAQGEILRWYATGTDIEDRKQAEETLQRSKARLKLLLDLTNRLVTKLELRDLLSAVTANVRQLMQCDLVAVFLAGSDPDKLRVFVVDFPEGKDFLGNEFRHTDGEPEVSIKGTLAGMVFRSGKTWRGNAADVAQLGLERDPGAAEGLKNGCVVPVICCDRVLGVLALGRKNENPFTQDDADFLGQVASQVAIAVDNALIVEARRRAEQALRQSEAYLAEAQALSHTGSWAHDVKTTEIIYWSPEAYRIFGFDPDKPISYRKAHSRIHPEDVPQFDAAREKGIREKAGSTVDFRVIHPDGSIRHVHCVSHAVLDASGEVVELVGTNMDVTEQYQARADLENAFEEIKKLKDELYRENLALKEEIDQSSMFEEIVGASEGLRRVLVQVAKVAPADSSVLITGETGTGKELIARAIHKRSQRSSRAFIGVNCAAVPADLIGSELFGHEKGAFTGATQRRLGRFELADGGTLFLDEVGDLPAETQIALLRVLQERQFERVGGTQAIAVNVRIIAATNRDLKAAVGAGAFRSDLFYRLNVFPIAMPPLRDRVDDIPLLVEYLIERYAGKAGKKIKRIQKSTLELFKAYDWPGNIRELQNVIERAVILCEGGTFSVDESWLQSEPPRAARAGGSLARPAPDKERALIEAALAETGGRIAGPSGAAARLGIPRSTLETKIRKLGIKKHKFNPA